MPPGTSPTTESCVRYESTARSTVAAVPVVKVSDRARPPPHRPVVSFEVGDSTPENAQHHTDGGHCGCADDGRGTEYGNEELIGHERFTRFHW